jgi:putative oxidoreductase
MTTIRTADHALSTDMPGKASNVALWTLQVLVALAFAAAGSGKLLGGADMIALFDAVGLGQWFRYVTGSLEVLGAILLIVPGTSAFGSVLLACVMAGAVVAHLAVLHTAPTAPFVLLALTALIAWGRRSQLVDLLGSTMSGAL